MSDNYSKILSYGVVGVVTLFLGWRVYSNWPTVIKGTGPVAKLELRSDSVTVILNEGIAISEIANMRIFERFDFDTSASEAEEVLGRADKWEKDGDASFSEYIRPMGRLRFYGALEYGPEGGIEGSSNWVEAMPNQLFADQFFDKSIARHLDLSKVNQNVYVSVPTSRSYLSVTLNGSHISKVVWLPNFH